MKRTSSLRVLLVVLVLVGIIGCRAKPPEAKSGEPVTYKIGFIAAITGGAAFLGEPERDAAAMVQEQINKQGGIKGSDGVMHPVEIIIYDTEGSGDVAITVVNAAP